MDNLLTGTGTVSGSALTVNLKPAFGVLKMTLTLPAAADGGTVYGVQVTTDYSIFRGAGSGSFTNIPDLASGSYATSGKIALNGSTGIAVPADRKLVCYMPILPRKSFGVGSITSIKVEVAKAYVSSSMFWTGAYTATKNLTADPAIPAEAGKMYRMELNFE